MAAPRKYSDQQRAAMYRLYERGYEPAEITRRCAEGMASVASFEVPRRTCHAIVTAMARERAEVVPIRLDEADDREAIDRFPARVATILDDEMARLEARQRNGNPLSANDLERLHKATAVHDRLLTSIARRGRPNAPQAMEVKQQRPEPGGLIGKLVQEEIQAAPTRSSDERP
jgi:hypothetical protein